MTEYFFALTLPPREEEIVNSWRRRFYPSSIKRHPPHLTIVPPFTYTDEEKLSEIFSQICRGLKEVNLSFKGLMTMGGEENILALRAEKTATLVILRESIIKALGLSVRQGFDPHLSIAKSKSKDFSEVRETLSREVTDFSVPGRSLVVYRGQRGGLWEEWQSYFFTK